VLVQKNSSKRGNDTLSFSDFHYIYKANDESCVPELDTTSIDYVSLSSRKNNATSMPAVAPAAAAAVAPVAQETKSSHSSSFKLIRDFFKVDKDQMGGLFVLSNNSDIMQSRDQKDAKGDGKGPGKGFITGIFQSKSHLPIENPADNGMYSASLGSMFGSMGIDKFYTSNENDNICMPDELARFSVKMNQNLSPHDSPAKQALHAEKMDDLKGESSAAPAVTEGTAAPVPQNSEDSNQVESVEATGGLTSKSKDSLGSDNITFFVG
jgi:hypothetical protein